MIPEVPIASPHLRMEKEFETLCKSKGLELVDLSYHHNFGDKPAEMLRRDFSPSSLAVRLSPDLLVQKKKDPSYNSFFAELKTGSKKDCIQAEAYQLLQNKVRERYMGTPCLYVYTGASTDYKMVACWSNDIRVKKLVIPDVEKNHQVRPTLENFFQVPLEERPYIKGYSNDAYVEIDKSNWKPITEYIN